MKLGFRLLAVLGSLAFGMAFALIFATPEFVERTGAHFIKHKIEQETHERIDSLTLQTSNSRLDKLAQKLLDNQQARITEIKTKIKASADAKIEDVFAQMSDFDCECRAKFSESIRQQLWIDVTLAEAAVAKVEDFLKAKYVDVVRNLRTDLRIFIGSNLAAFLSLLLVSLVKPRAAPQLLVPGMILMCAVVICSYFYIFQQNWFLTIIYSDYVGFAYLAYLGGVFSLLCDVSLNRGRVTAEICNFLLEAVGSAASVQSC